MSFVSR